MKIKDIEGSPKEIGEFCEVQNFCIENYLDDKPRPNSWVLIGIVVLFLGSCITQSQLNLSNNAQYIITSINLSLIGVIASVSQLLYSDKIITWIAILFGVIILGISTNILSLNEAIISLFEKSK